MYQAYDDFMGEEEEVVASRKVAVKTGARRKRDTVDKLGVDKEHTVRAARKEGESELETKAPETLKEKVALDFKRPALVDPTPELAVKQTQGFSCFGRLKPEQKFTNDKPCFVRPAPRGALQEIDGDFGF